MLLKNILKNLKLNEGSISTIMGLGIMILTGFLLIQYFRNTNNFLGSERTLSTSTIESTTIFPEDPNNPNKVTPKINPGSNYAVESGDSLWKISVKTYGDGYQWTKVYEANKQTIGDNPSLLAVGTKLAIPKLEEAKVVDYTVIKGDSLWSISANTCGDGFIWTQVASDNKIDNPRLIYPGTVLKITCPRK